MRPLLLESFVITVCIALLVVPGKCHEEAAVRLGDGVKAVWDIEKAYHRSTPTRERICINGLWRWQPASEKTNAVPDEDWGYFKAPGS